MCIRDRDSERLLPHQTVVIRERRIAEIGPASQVRAPRDARRIDGRGKYLMPGLADMHAHPDTKLDLLLYVADGVTTVRTMGTVSYTHLRAHETPEHLVCRLLLE